MVGLRGHWDALLSKASELAPYAVELSAYSGPELHPLLMYLRGHPWLHEFRYVSVHAPAKQWLKTDAVLVEKLELLPSQIESIVLHPDHLKNLDAFVALGVRAVLENVDCHARTGRTPAELAKVFDCLPDAGFCLDIAHAASMGPGMTVALDLLDTFGDRLRQVHVNSMSRGSAALTDDDCQLFMSVLDRCRHVPWILEAPLVAPSATRGRRRACWPEAPPS